MIGVKYNKKEYPDMRVPIVSWCPWETLGYAWEQALHLSYHPIIYRQVSLMADAGEGYGMPNGSVIACKNALIPFAVGKDIGCGMRWVKTSLTIHDFEDRSFLREVLDIIRETVPVGFEHQTQRPINNLQWPDKLGVVTKQQADSIEYQLGTLGGGNHFIEFQADEMSGISFMIHSGSRNFGAKVCTHYNKVAQRLNWRWHSKTDSKWNLAFLPIGSPEAREYIDEMKFAMQMAFENRRLIAERVKEALNKVFYYEVWMEKDVHHNYAVLENHFGQNVWVHRKGAIRAMKGDVGIIPGSMGANSYIVRGLGNPKSFTSCSHGAGRPRSCTDSSRILDKVEQEKLMEGIEFGDWGVNRKGMVDLSEAPGAYKNIETVMNNQKDLVEILIKLRPLGVVKKINTDEDFIKE